MILRREISFFFLFSSLWYWVIVYITVRVAYYIGWGLLGEGGCFPPWEQRLHDTRLVFSSFLFEYTKAAYIWWGRGGKGGALKGKSKAGYC